ncbi:unnamed protein product, partial [Didymodactylos carnosus]
MVSSVWIPEIEGNITKVGSDYDSFVQWLYPYTERVTKLNPIQPPPMHSVKRILIFMDGRCEKRQLFTVQHTYYLLDSLRPQSEKTWGVFIIHTPQCEHFWIENLKVYPQGSGHHIRLFQLSEIVRNTANYLPVSSVFLSDILPSNVQEYLYVQADGTMLRSPYLPSMIDGYTNGTLFEELLSKYPILGAPLPEFQARHMGQNFMPIFKFLTNGGMTFRKRSVMMDLISKIKCDSNGKQQDHCYRTDLFLTHDHSYSSEDWFIALQISQREYYRRQFPSQIMLAQFAIEHGDPLFLPQAQSDTQYNFQNRTLPFFLHQLWGKRKYWMPLLAQVG